MIAIDSTGSWAQWDQQINTYRCEVGGVVYGTYTAEINSITALGDLLTTLGIALTAEQRSFLTAQRAID